MRLAIRLPFLLIHLYTNIASTGPVSLKAEPGYAQLLDRAACFTYCGYSSQVCCSAGYVCSTDQNTQAQCAPSVYNPTPATAAGFAATSTSTLICDGNQGQKACGDKCCSAGQTCLSPGQCSEASPTPAPSTAATMATTVTATSVPATVAGVDSPATVTTTAVAATVTTSSTTTVGSTGLDSGSIAGIIIGVIVGVLVLAWMCAPLTNRNKSVQISSISSRSSRDRGSRRSRR